MPSDTLSGRDRRPSKDEVLACIPHLDLQIEIMEAKSILTPGDTAIRYVFREWIRVVLWREESWGKGEYMVT